ncbi:MAG: acylneuraminate cytidylyltransferase family protein [Leptospirales bacterium]
MKALAIVPARGGSKRLPKKNLRHLGGKPLVCHTLDAVQESEKFAKVILSSDDSDLLALAENYEIVIPEKREERLSGDKVTVLTLINEIAARPDIKDEFDVISLLLPTCPFRNASHIQGGMDLLDKDVDGVISVTEYEFPPQLGITLDNNIIKPVFEPCPLITGNTRSQDQDVIYRPNGGFYIQWMEKFLINQNFWKGKVKGYAMGRMDSLDIDTELDLEYAEFVYNKK